MSQPTLDLGKLFNAALQTMATHRQDINALDGYNGNHGDNMVANLRLITEALQAQSSKQPAQALEYASQQLQSQGHGGTSQYYAQGLSQAAQQLQGRSSLGNEDVMTLVQSLLGAIPAQGHPQQPQASGSVLEQMMGLATGMSQAPQPAQQTPQAGGNILGQLLGMVGGQAAQGQEQDDGLDIGDVLNTLLPAGLAFLQAKQSGADTTTAIGQALTSALVGGQMNPLQANTPRAAAGGLVAQSILRALTNLG